MKYIISYHIILVQLQGQAAQARLDVLQGARGVLLGWYCYAPQL